MRKVITVGMVHDMLQNVPLPKMVYARQLFDREKIENPAQMMRDKLLQSGLLQKVQPKQKIAITVGSRGIANLTVMVAAIVSVLKEMGADPFIFPAMGSHGGATAEGQKKMLADLGVSEETVGAPVFSTMETVQIGSSENGLPVYLDAYAAKADGIILMNRIKPHTSFRGPYESGLMKMTAIGCGKQKGADICHNLGFGKMAENIPAIGKTFIEKTNILCAIAVLENAYDETAQIHVMDKTEIAEKEPQLLIEAKTKLPKIAFTEFDCLIIDQIGKNYSGTGFDPNIVGKYHSPYASGGPQISRTCALDLSDISHGNANGIGILDFTTRRLFDKMIWEQTYPNALTSTAPLAAKIPMVLENDKLCIQAMIKTANIADKSQVRMVRIANTLHLEHIYFSESLLPLAQKDSHLQILTEPQEMIFNENGNLFESII